MHHNPTWVCTLEHLLKTTLGVLKKQETDTRWRQISILISGRKAETLLGFDMNWRKTWNPAEKTSMCSRHITTPHQDEWRWHSPYRTFAKTPLKVHGPSRTFIVGNIYRSSIAIFPGSLVSLTYYGFFNRPYAYILIPWSILYIFHGRAESWVCKTGTMDKLEPWRYNGQDDNDNSKNSLYCRIALYSPSQTFPTRLLLFLVHISRSVKVQIPFVSILEWSAFQRTLGLTFLVEKMSSLDTWRLAPCCPAPIGRE